jgi:hypothetical protein
MAASSDSAASRDPTTRGAASPRSLITWRLLSALFLLAMGGIHLYLVVFGGTGGVLGFLFMVNAIGGLVLAVAMLVAQRGLLVVASVLSLLLMAGTLLALVLALTVSLFGIRQQLSGELVVPTLIVESIGTIVLVVTTALAFQKQRRHAS